MSVELITMAAGGLAGFIFRYLAERAKERAEIYKMAIGMKKAQDESADKAAKRVPIDAGKWVRRAIVCAILFAVVLAPFILSLTGHSTIVQVETEAPTWLFGLFGGGTEIMFVEMKGYLMIPEVRQALTAIIGFYFGNAAAKTK
tara:strand:- start:53 stop:484 length:432 start_codon:yes stop_codon:yes gene_type:complete